MKHAPPHVGRGAWGLVVEPIESVGVGVVQVALFAVLCGVAVAGDGEGGGGGDVFECNLTDESETFWMEWRCSETAAMCDCLITDGNNAVWNGNTIKVAVLVECTITDGSNSLWYSVTSIRFRHGIPDQ